MNEGGPSLRLSDGGRSSSTGSSGSSRTVTRGGRVELDALILADGCASPPRSGRAFGLAQLWSPRRSRSGQAGEDVEDHHPRPHDRAGDAATVLSRRLAKSRDSPSLGHHLHAEPVPILRRRLGPCWPHREDALGCPQRRKGVQMRRPRPGAVGCSPGPVEGTAKMLVHERQTLSATFACSLRMLHGAPSPRVKAHLRVDLTDRPCSSGSPRSISSTSRMRHMIAGIACQPLTAGRLDRSHASV